MSTPNWIADLDSKVTGMPFGEVVVVVKRHRSRTVEVTYKSNSKIRYLSNKKAFSDLEKIINSMITAQLTGKLAFDVDFKKGTIELITIKNKDIKDYRG